MTKDTYEEKPSLAASMTPRESYQDPATFTPTKPLIIDPMFEFDAPKYYDFLKRTPVKHYSPYMRDIPAETQKKTEKLCKRTKTTLQRPFNLSKRNKKNF